MPIMKVISYCEYRIPYCTFICIMLQMIVSLQIFIARQFANAFWTYQVEQELRERNDLDYVFHGKRVGCLHR